MSAFLLAGLREFLAVRLALTFLTLHFKYSTFYKVCQGVFFSHGVYTLGSSSAISPLDNYSIA